jgi:uncharacterized protein YjbI with pentapeptide repeats
MVNHTKLTLILLLAMLISAGKAATEPSGLNVVEAGDILAKVQMGEAVNYAFVIVNGDLNLSAIGLSASNLINSPITIRDSEIHGMVNFNDCIFKNPIYFERTHFFKPAYFIKTQFKGIADFEASQFNNSASFKMAQFMNSTNFYGARFDGSVDFWSTNFKGASVDFSKSQFKDSVRFWYAIFDAESMNFEESKFNKAVSFKNAAFHGGCNFKLAQFEKTADFEDSSFDAPVDFLGARFDNYIYLSGIKFVSIQLTWDSLSEKLVCDGPTYATLIKNFKDLEQYEDADDCYYQYRDWRRVNGPLEWAKILDYIAWLSCGYGVRWHYTIFSGILVMILFGLYYESYNLKNVIPNFFRRGDSKKACKHEFKENLKKAISFSAITLLSLPSEWAPFGGEDYTKFVKDHLCCTIFERMIGWGLMLLFIGTLSRLMVRY